MSMQRREIPVDAPAFDPDRNDYPLSGTKTGPAWRAAWALLRVLPFADYASASDLIEYVRERHPDAHPETVRNLLYAAVRAGILESTLRLEGKRNRAYFRIAR